MAQDNLNAEPLAVWETEGGNTGSMFGDNEGELPMPALPRGYSAQPQWGFEDESARLIYEFHRVYRTEAVERAHARSLEGHLTPELCYWLVSWTGRGPSGDEYPLARWVTFGQARKRFRGLSFTRFSTERGPWLNALLHVEDIILPAPSPLREQRAWYQEMSLH